MAIDQRVNNLAATVDQWTEARQALSRRVDLVEQTADQHGDLLMHFQGQISDLQERAIFAQRLSRETATIVIRVPIDQVKTVICTVVQATSSLLAIEVLR